MIFRFLLCMLFGVSGECYVVLSLCMGFSVLVLVGLSKDDKVDNERGAKACT